MRVSALIPPFLGQPLLSHPIPYYASPGWARLRNCRWQICQINPTQKRELGSPQLCLLYIRSTLRSRHTNMYVPILCSASHLKGVPWRSEFFNFCLELAKMNCWIFLFRGPQDACHGKPVMTITATKTYFWLVKRNWLVEREEGKLWKACSRRTEFKEARYCGNWQSTWAIIPLVLYVWMRILQPQEQLVWRISPAFSGLFLILLISGFFVPQYFLFRTMFFR